MDEYKEVLNEEKENQKQESSAEFSKHDFPYGADIHSTSEENYEPLGFVDYFKTMLLQPEEFFSKHFLKSKDELHKKVMIFFLIGVGLDRVETMLAKSDLGYGSGDVFEAWALYWGGALLIGFTLGFLSYYIGGAIYQLRMGWSGSAPGESDIALHLFSHTSVPYFMVSLITSILDTLLYPSPMLVGVDDNGAWILVRTLVTVLMLSYSIYLSYMGVTILTSASKGKALIWFAILPAIFYVVIFGGAVMLAFNSF